MKTVKIFTLMFCIGLLFGITSCAVHVNKDNGKHKGWYKNSNTRIIPIVQTLENQKEEKIRKVLSQLVSKQVTCVRMPARYVTLCSLNDLTFTLLFTSD